MDIAYRASHSGDAKAICQHRVAMFIDMGFSADCVEAMRSPFLDWVRTRLEDGRYFGVTAESEGQDIGHAGAMLIDWPPPPTTSSPSERGYIFNVHVEPDFRRRGIARTLIQRIEQMMRNRGVSLAALHASDAGRPLYLDLGWTPSKEMEKPLL